MRQLSKLGTEWSFFFDNVVVVIVLVSHFPKVIAMCVVQVFRTTDFGKIVAHGILVRAKYLLVLLQPKHTDLLTVDYVLLLEHLHQH
jgi:hypothetical protein